MVCYTGKSKQLKSLGDISGERLSCIAAPSGFIFGENTMNCKHETCPLLEVSLIPLSQGKFAIVDTEDSEYLMRWKWYVLKGYTLYAVRHTHRIQTDHIKRTQILMHRELLGLHKGDRKEADHRNHNGLDNRKSNLRICNHAENSRNQLPRKNCQSRYKGICDRHGKWQVYIRFNGKRLHLGTYTSEIEAAKAYDAKARELFGEFAYCNFG